jgi:hypothetical protein
MKRVLGERNNEFAGLKGASLHGGPLEAWTPNVSFPGMMCSLVRYDEKSAANLALHPKGGYLSQFRCITPADSHDGKKHLSSVFAAFRLSAPSWKWFKGDADFLGNTAYYGGPTRDEVYAVVTFMPRAGETMEFLLDSVPVTIPAGSPVKPYVP